MIYNEGYSTCPPEDRIFRGEGCHIYDASCRRYIDLAMGGGALILGHAPNVVVEAVRKQVAAGSIYTTPNAAAYAMDELLDRCIPWLPARVWCNSGSEAVMRLCRIARAVTGKEKVAIFSGCWHGSWEGTLVEEDYDAGGPHPAMKLRSAGVLSQIRDSLLMLPYRDPAALSLIREHKDELACVLVEPVQGSCPSAEAGAFLHSLREVCHSCGVLLAVDEVVTGFRLALGGGQEYFDVHADLAAYGKIVGGGLPAGLVAGTGFLMDSALQAGVFFGGTFSANPLTIAAGHAVLSWLAGEGSGPQHNVYSLINSAGALLRAAVNDDFRSRGIPAHMMGAGSISRLVFSDKPATSRRERDQLEEDTATQRVFYRACRDKGLHIGTNRIQFLSSAHGMQEIAEIVGVLCQTMHEMS